MENTQTERNRLHFSGFFVVRPIKPIQISLRRDKFIDSYNWEVLKWFGFKHSCIQRLKF